MEAQPVGIDDDGVLLDEAADAGDFGDAVGLATAKRSVSPAASAIPQVRSSPTSAYW